MLASITVGVPKNDRAWSTVDVRLAAFGFMVNGKTSSQNKVHETRIQRLRKFASAQQATNEL